MASEMCSIDYSGKEGTLKVKIVISFAAVLIVAVVGCEKKDDGSKDNKIGQLETKLQHAQEIESTLEGEVKQLNQRVTRLQNDFKIYSQNPASSSSIPSSSRSRGSHRGACGCPEPWVHP